MSYYLYKRDSSSKTPEGKWKKVYSPLDEGSKTTYKTVGTYKITKPTVINLGGNGTVDDASANGMAKRSENAVGIGGDDVDLITIKYRLEPNIAIPRGTFNYDEAKDFVTNLLLPLAVDQNGNRLSLDLACKQMRLVTVDAYCYGNVAKNIIVSALIDQLGIKGYSADECLTIAKQLVCICYAPKYSEHKNYTYNFYIKSLNDPMFGLNYHNEKYGDDFSPKNLGCGLIEQSGDTVNLYTENLSIENDHDITNTTRNKKWKLIVDNDDEYSLTAEAASICHAAALEYAILNSFANFNSQTYVPFNLSVVAEDCQSIINVFNNSTKGQQLIAENQQKIDDYIKQNTEVPFKDVLKELGITEKQILSGEKPINKFMRDYKGIVIYNGQYKKIVELGRCYLNNFAKKRIATKTDVVALEIVHESGFILNNGDLILCRESKNMFYSALYAKLFQGLNLENSIKFEVQTINGVKCLKLSDNYGSINTPHKKLSELQTDWKAYNNCDLTISPSEGQRVVVQNICTQFNIDKKNILTNTLTLSV